MFKFYRQFTREKNAELEMEKRCGFRAYFYVRKKTRNWKAALSKGLSTGHDLSYAIF